MGAAILTYLSMGSNLGDRMLNLENAMTLLRERAGRVIAVSRTYESIAWGYSSDHPYFNRCLSLSTTLNASGLMELLLGIEKDLGRIRSDAGYADRLIDIDLLLFGDRVIEESGLSIPHPNMNERRFVLVPLNEIAAGVIHPIAGYTIEELLARCNDPGRVRPV